MRFAIMQAQLIRFFLVTAILCGCSEQRETDVPAKSGQTPQGLDASAESTETVGLPIQESSSHVAIQNESPDNDVALGDAFQGTSYALLVGCTVYDHLGEGARLRGPVNDVEMMREILTTQFQFSKAGMRVLTEAAGKDNRPIKANIVRELKWLADTVKQGDRVVLLLSGHGSQQPDNDPANPDDPEPDGLDEIFCPADIRAAESLDEPYAINSLTDDELREAIANIRKNGVFVWVIVDACHSGSAVRGTEVLRQIPPAQLFSQQILSKARSMARSNSRSVKQEESALDPQHEAGGFVAIYAAQPHEPTLEMVLPDESDDSQWRGLLTYTLGKILTSAQTPLSYRELVQRVHSEYIYAYGRLGPTPLIEGVDQNKMVLGQSSAESQTALVLSVSESGDYTVNAGQLRGFTTGTIFAVYPPAGELASEVSLGHVQMKDPKLTESVVVPEPRDDGASPSAFPIGSQLTAVEVPFGPLFLKVGVDEQSESAEKESIQDMLQAIQGEPGKRIRLVDDNANADWIVRRTKNDELYLLPAEGWSAAQTSTQFGPAPETDQMDWLSDRLGRISRVRSLLRLCDASKRQTTGGFLSFLSGKPPCRINLEMKSISAETNEAEAIDWTARSGTLDNGQQVLLEIKNTGRETSDFSVLFIDSEFGITPLFPSFGVIADNRLEPGQDYSLGPLQVEASTLGLEHLIVIATVAKGQPLDFSWLGQESLETMASSSRAVLRENPLGELFSEALYSKQNVRGLRVAEAESTCLRLVSWKTVAESGSQESQ